MPDQVEPEMFMSEAVITATAFAVHPEGAVVPEPDPVPQDIGE